jgi:hypothetical protein
MNLFRIIAIVSCAALAIAAAAEEIEDPGKETVARVTVSVLLGTNGDASVAGEHARDVPADTETRLRAEERLRFNHYRLLGDSRRRVYRSYENWAQPLYPSEEVLVRFEAQGKLREKKQRLDIDLWLSRKKILKTDAVVGIDCPMFILGPEWRGGRLIIMIALAPEPRPGQ